MSTQLTPDQSEKLADGWHTAIVLGVADFDTLHMALTLSYCDSSTIALWENIRKQLDQLRFVRKMEAMVNEL